MISTGLELTTFITGLNAEATIDATLLETLVENGRSILEEERPWIVLRKTDKSKTVTTSNTWQTAIDLSTIADFSRFFGDEPIILFDGTNTREYYYQKPIDRRLEYKDASGTFCYDENAKILYLNGVVPFSGTLWINYICTSPDIDLTEDTDQIWALFPKRFLPLLGYYAIGVYKGAVDYDSINKQMLPSNQAALFSLKNAIEKWDNEKQLSEMSNNDPTERGHYPRSGAVNRNED